MHVDVANRLESIRRERDYVWNWNNDDTGAPGTRKKAGKPCLLIFFSPILFIQSKSILFSSGPFAPEGCV